MNLQSNFKNTVAELQAKHGNCFESGFREFNKRGFIFHLQFTNRTTNRSKAAIRKRLDSFLQKVKSHEKNLEKAS